MESLASEIREFVVRNFLFGRPDPRFTNTASFMELGIIDSTGVLELIQHLETRYGIKVEDEELAPENLDSIENLVGFVERKRPKP